MDSSTRVLLHNKDNEKKICRFLRYAWRTFVILTLQTEESNPIPEPNSSPIVPVVRELRDPLLNITSEITLIKHRQNVITNYAYSK